MTCHRSATRPLLFMPMLAAASQVFGYESTFPSDWLKNVSQTQEEQPHWMTPLVTVTPRLEQEFRYDQSRQHVQNGTTVDNYGGNKGFEFIPSEDTEVIVGIPAYEQKATKATTVTGWADESFLLKYRLLASNEEGGNYIISTFLGLTVPTGDEAFSNHHTLFTPTLAAGKGWGGRESGFDIQSTLSAAIPSGGKDTLGIPVVWNIAVQAHVGKVFWPEMETSLTHWEDGTHAGKNQIAMTYGLILGRFTIENRVKAIVGLGYQAVETSFETFNHALLGTARLTF